MPTRARLASSTAIEVIEAPTELQYQMPGLQFSEPLSWRAGKPIPVTDLLRRLQSLSQEMREMNQEENERESFTKVAKELVNPNLLSHKDKGIRAWTACCLVDILRLCAPDAPYTGQQLKDIFTLLIMHILPALSDPSNAYNNQHMYVLQSLAQVKSIVLVTDLPHSEALVQHLFVSFFDILSGSSKASTGEQLGKSVELNMTEILVIMVDEAPSLPSGAVDSIIAQFFRTDPRALGAHSSKGKKNGAAQVVGDKQSTLVLKELPPAYTMAKTICNHCTDKMAREISQYFTEVITDASNTTSSSKERSHRRNSDDFDDMDGTAMGPTEEDLTELYKAHSLLRELWRASPGVLQNVIPQLEAELSAENIQLRLLATETLGDIVSGIGAAGPPPPPVMDGTTYPPIDISHTPDTQTSMNILTTPSSPKPFPQVHPHTYLSFLGRRQDKSSIIRAAWTIGVGRILTTSAGGVGLSQHEEQLLVEYLAQMLNDSDEKVRLAAVKVIGNFSLKDVITKFGSSGSINTSGSVLSNLSERVKDKKSTVRSEAMKILARIWAVSFGEIAAGNEQVVSIIGAAPSRILHAYYANELEIHLLMDHVIFEILLPLAYPPIKVRAPKLTNGNSQRVKDSQPTGDREAETPDPDKIRAERILFLIKGLDEKAKKVFYMFQSRQVALSGYMNHYLKSCEDYNGGVMDGDEETIKKRLTTIIGEFAKLSPDPSKVTSDLWKFAKMHDRRSYQLLRFCFAPESDYRTMYRAIKELTKRIDTSTTAPAGLLETLTPLIYRISLVVYNKSHVPAIMEFSKTDEKSLAGTAHEMLKDISSRTPEVLKAHVQEICKTLQEDAPTAAKANDAGSVDNLKACASFAKKYSKDIPQDRKFVQAMTSFALYGTPPEAAKHAISVIMAASEKKEMIAKDLVHQCVKDFKYGDRGFLSRLAALSQLWLLAPTEIDKDGDAVIDIAIKEILLQVRTPSTAASDEYLWSPEVETECAAKCWALKILVNRLRSHSTPSTLAEVAEPIYTLLSTLIFKEGELASAKNTPPTHKPRLRLIAARLYLKLCTSKPHEVLLTPLAFNRLAEVAQDALFPVRSSFLSRLKKYLSRTQLTPRFYTIPFLLAFEPDTKFKDETATWLKSRVVFFSGLKQRVSSLSASAIGPTSKPEALATKASTVLELVFARLISLLAHHPDYGHSSSDLIDFARYILFYLFNVANSENISLIYHVAERVKGCRDAVSPNTSPGAKAPTPGDGEEPVEEQSFDQRLYTLSDLAKLTVRLYEESHNWSIQTLPSAARLTLPRSLYTEIKDHDTAMDIAERIYLPDLDEVREGVEGLVRRLKTNASGVSRKRRSDGLGLDEHGGGKKAKKSLPVRESKPKPPKPTKPAAKSKKKNGTSAKKSATWDSDAEDEDEDNSALSSSDEERHSHLPDERESRVSPDTSRRRSGRVSGVSYKERKDEEDDEEMEMRDQDPDEAEEGDEDEDDGEGEEDQPPAPVSAESKPKPPPKSRTPKTTPPKAKTAPAPKARTKTRAPKTRAATGTGSGRSTRSKAPASTTTAPLPNAPAEGDKEEGSGSELSDVSSSD